MGRRTKVCRLKDKQQIEFYREKIKKKIEKNPQMAQKMALIISKMLTETS